MSALLVALGAAAGAPARYVLHRALPQRRGTLLVNVVGSFLLGAVSSRVDPAASSYLLVGVGFCGAFTTFSTFALEAWEAPQGQRGRYLALTLALCIGAAWLGLRT